MKLWGFRVMKVSAKLGACALFACALTAGPGAVSPVLARTVVSVGVGMGPGWYGPPPAYRYGPPPAYVVAPPPAYVMPSPPVVVAPTAPTWLYCGNPAGYYPYVQACALPWQQVPAVVAPTAP